jgi:hypothetical protein
MDKIKERHEQLKRELKAETKDNLILAKKIYLKRFEMDNGLI